MKYDHYPTIEKAIHFIRNHYDQQPSLEEIARNVHLSPSHFQKVFTEWAGVSPKSFLSHISINYAKYLLRDGQLSLFDTAEKTGLSGTGRLHDLFVNIEGMTPGDYKNKGLNLHICYESYPTLFGNIMIASTDKGICYVHFYDHEKATFSNLVAEYPEADFIRQTTPLHQQVLYVINGLKPETNITLHVKGSPFRLKVWNALLSVAEGQLTTYQQISNKIQSPEASRAVGSAIGANPVAYLIPCHRVIRTDGGLGGYRWGVEKKCAIIAKEQMYGMDI